MIKIFFNQGPKPAEILTWLEERKIRFIKLEWVIPTDIDRTRTVWGHWEVTGFQTEH